MKALINPRSAALLAAASAVLLSSAPAPATAAASAVPSAVTDRHAARHDGLCDGHKWSLFGCRTDHARHLITPPDADDSPSAG